MADFTIDRSIVDAPDGPEIIVAKGEGASERMSEPHSHARGQLFGSTRGLLTVGVENAVWVVPAIHAVWLPPHHRHWAQSHGVFEGWSAYILESHCAVLPPEPCTIAVSGLLREAVLRAAAWPVRPLDPIHQHLAAVIVEEIRRQPPEPLGLPMPADPRLARVAKALIADPADARDIECWARVAATSSRTLSRRFVAETGFTFTEWRQRARLLRALELLADETAVNTIALDLGYSTASAFIALFRKTFGCTPTAYRKLL